ncbi:MAG: ABC transporter ATP-binding protein [Saprospiraceae bacterium]
MKNFFRILQFARPYRQQIAFSILFNILMVVFSLGSITILIPVLKIIFENTQSVIEPATYTGLINLKSYLESQLNYYITTWSAQIGQQRVLFYILLFTCTLFLLKNLFRFLGAAFLTYLKNVIERDLRDAIHDKMLHLPISFFTEKRKGDVIARLTTDIVEIQWAVLSSIQRMIQEPLLIFTTIILLVVLSPKLTLFVVILLPLTGFIITYIGNTLKKPAKQAKDELANILSLVEENLSGLPIIKSYVAEQRTQQRFIASNQRHFQFMNAVLYRRELSSPISEILGSFVIIAIVWFGSVLILERNELEAEVFITYVVLFYQIINPAKAISLAVYDIKRGDASAQRIMELLDTPNHLEDQPNALSKTDFTQQIELKQVGFRYSEQHVLQQINLVVPRGKTVALVGQSGSGKTTMAYLLNRFYDVTEGEILVDNLNITTIKLKDLRQLIGYISQNAILFNDTIANNLRFGNENATEAEMIAAAKAANAHDFILKTDNGYQTNIGDSGQKLSGGQRQRLTIARAILKNPPILILDEATSALDSESEKLVQDALNKVMENRTSIVIAHRLSTIQNADLIVVMREGNIIETGTHQELIAQQGEYDKLVQLQAF